jgi:hypothetical protein
MPAAARPRPWAESWFYTKENPWGDAKPRRFTAYEDLAQTTRRRMATMPSGTTAGGWCRAEEYVFPKLDAEPLADLRNTNRIRHVMKLGRFYDGSTLEEWHPTKRPGPVGPNRPIVPDVRAGIP